MVGLPVGDDDLGLDQVVELVQVQAFVAAPVVERFDVTVQPRLARGDVVHPDPVLAVLTATLGTPARVRCPRGSLSAVRGR